MRRAAAAVAPDDAQGVLVSVSRQPGTGLADQPLEEDASSRPRVSTAVRRRSGHKCLGGGVERVAAVRGGQDAGAGGCHGVGAGEPQLPGGMPGPAPRRRPAQAPAAATGRIRTAPRSSQRHTKAIVISQWV